MSDFKKEEFWVIAIDGLSGSGKSTLSKQLASHYSAYFLNTGLVYRAVGLTCLENSVNPTDNQAVDETFGKYQFTFKPLDGTTLGIFRDNKLLTELMANPEVSEAASQVAQNKMLRKKLLPIQQNARIFGNLVAEGRDVGSVVFPDALYKILIDVPMEVRIGRRLKQMDSAQIFNRVNGSNYETIIGQEVVERDFRDRENTNVATNVDVIVFNNDGLSLNEALEKLIMLTKEKINS
jgi:cytidylate kinase